MNQQNCGVIRMSYSISAVEICIHNTESDVRNTPGAIFLLDARQVILIRHDDKNQGLPLDM